MRQSITTALLLLAVQLPRLTHGLPYPRRRGDDYRPFSLSSSATIPGDNAGSDAVQISLHPTEKDTPQLTPVHDGIIVQEMSVQEEGGTESVLERELAELELLHHKLAELESEIYAREQWLAKAVGAGSPGGIIDCDGVKCVVRTVLRRIKYATAVIFGVDVPHARVIPLPPWRSPSQENNNRYDTDTEGTHGLPDDASDFIDSSITLKLALLFLLLLTLFRVVISCARSGGGAFDGPSSMAGPPGWYEIRVQENRQWQGFWPRGWRGFGGFQEQGRREARRLGAIGEVESSHECDYGYGNGCGGEKRWPKDEKDAMLFDERYKEDNNPEAERENEDEDEDGEPLTLAEEIASFRAVADMVGDIIAAEESRTRGR
ncbi:hypothetical protein MFIFM68171_08993 [Madurella fahalii]|uniref:Uncharacterized protein n=1 Tax=Madurella fahalii TaxID=1157608 RepID=A0ABQ0GLZ4_9PEZI